MHKISDEFEFRSDRTTDCGKLPWASKKFPIDLQWENGVSMLARSFFIKSSSKLLVIRTGIKAWSSSILGQIRPLILESLALEWRKFHTFELEYFWSQLVNLDQILCIAALGWGKGFGTDWITQVGDRCPLGYLFFNLNAVLFTEIALGFVISEGCILEMSGNLATCDTAFVYGRSAFYICLNQCSTK